MRLLMIDNYDSFTYNLVQYLGELGSEVDVVRNDEASVDELLARGADGLVISPGPGEPTQAGVSVECVTRFGETGTPVLGVCLGHQSIGAAYGANSLQILLARRYAVGMLAVCCFTPQWALCYRHGYSMYSMPSESFTFIVYSIVPAT